MKKASARSKKLRIKDVRWCVLDSGERLKPSVKRRVLAVGPAAIPELVQLFTEPDLLPHFARNAVALLIAFDEPGQRALLEALLSINPNSEAHDEAVQQLTRVGHSIGEFVIPLLDTNNQRPLHDGAVEIIARCGTKLPEARPILEEYLRQQPARAAGLIADYGDPQFLDSLLALFDEFALSDHEHTKGNMSVKELGEAILTLGGELNQEQRLKLNMATAMLKHQQRALTFDYKRKS